MEQISLQKVASVLDEASGMYYDKYTGLSLLGEQLFAEIPRGDSSHVQIQKELLNRGFRLPTDDEQRRQLITDAAAREAPVQIRAAQVGFREKNCVFVLHKQVISTDPNNCDILPPSFDEGSLTNHLSLHGSAKDFNEKIASVARHSSVLRDLPLLIRKKSR